MRVCVGGKPVRTTFHILFIVAYVGVARSLWLLWLLRLYLNPKDVVRPQYIAGNIIPVYALFSIERIAYEHFVIIIVIVDTPHSVEGMQTVSERVPS